MGLGSANLSHWKLMLPNALQIDRVLALDAVGQPDRKAFIIKPEPSQELFFSQARIY